MLNIRTIAIALATASAFIAAPAYAGDGNEPDGLRQVQMGYTRPYAAPRAPAPRRTARAPQTQVETFSSVRDMLRFSM